MSEFGWRPFRRLGNKIGAEVRKVDRQVLLPGGGEVAVRSADHPDSLRGEGLDFVVLDECAYIAEEAWIEALRPALSDRRGKAMFISTPKGRNWFWRLYMQAQDGDEGDWQAWRFPTSANPYIDAAEIAAAKEQLPEATFKQEYLAEFIEDAGLIFRNISQCLGDGPSAPAGKRRYVMGVDWGQVQDFTALIVMEAETKQVCEIDRFNQIGWDIQRARLAAMAERWGVSRILAEHNSIGGPNIEQLQSEGLPVRGFQTTSQSKQDVMVALQLAFEREEILIPDDEALINELRAFEAERLPSGRWRYSSPSGMHDDTVIALALAYEAANRPVGMRIAQTTGGLYGAGHARRPTSSRDRRSGGLYGSRR